MSVLAWLFSTAAISPALVSSTLTFAKSLAPGEGLALPAADTLVMFAAIASSLNVYMAFTVRPPHHNKFMIIIYVLIFIRLFTFTPTLFDAY